LTILVVSFVSRGLLESHAPMTKLVCPVVNEIKDNKSAETSALMEDFGLKRRRLLW